MNRKIWFGSGVAVLILGGIAFLAKNDTPQEAKKAPVAAYVAAEGTVEAMPGYDVDLGTGELNGRVDRILVKEGEQVKAGQVVAVLENRDLQARVRNAEQQLSVAQAALREVESGPRPEELQEAAAAVAGAKAAMEESQRQRDRFRTLRGQGMVSQSSLDEKERLFETGQSAYRQALAREKLLRAGPKAETVALYRDRVRLARTDLDYTHQLLDKTVIRSPIAGVVVQRYLDEGEGITPEIPILGIADTGKMWINAEVDETDVGKVHLGDPVEITSDAYRGKVFRGEVRQIAEYAGSRKIRPGNPAVNLGLKVVQVKVGLLAPTPLRLGMTVDVKIRPR